MQIIIAVIGFLLSGSIFFFYTKPTYDQTKATQAQIAQYDSVLQKVAEIRRIKDALLAKYNAFKPTDIDRLQKMLPDHVDNVRLILDLDNLAGKHGIALQNVDVTSSAARSSPGSGAVEIGSSDQKFDSLTFTFATEATYTTFLRFLNDLESSLRIVDLVTLTMDPAGATQTTNSSEPRYSFKLTLRTYWLK